MLVFIYLFILIVASHPDTFMLYVCIPVHVCYFCELLLLWIPIIRIYPPFTSQMYFENFPFQVANPLRTFKACGGCNRLRSQFRQLGELELLAPNQRHFEPLKGSKLFANSKRVIFGSWQTHRFTGSVTYCLNSIYSLYWILRSQYSIYSLYWAPRN